MNAILLICFAFLIELFHCKLAEKFERGRETDGRTTTVCEEKRAQFVTVKLGANF